MSPLPFALLMFGDLVMVMSLCWILHKLSDMWFNKKERPKQTDIVCPISKKKLTDQELFLGKCSSCYRVNGLTSIQCDVDIKKQIDVKG